MQTFAIPLGLITFFFFSWIDENSPHFLNYEKLGLFFIIIFYSKGNFFLFILRLPMNASLEGERFGTSQSRSSPTAVF